MITLRKVKLKKPVWSNDSICSMCKSEFRLDIDDVRCSTIEDVLNYWFRCPYCGEHTDIEMETFIQKVKLQKLLRINEVYKRIKRNTPESGYIK